MDISINGSDKMVRKKKGNEEAITAKVADRAEGKVNVGISCIGDICFTEDGFNIKVGKDCDIEFVKEITKRILGGNSKVTFEVNPPSEDEIGV